MNFKDFVQEFVTRTKSFIAYYETIKDLTGEEKKIRLYKRMTDFANSLLDDAKVNFFVKFIIKHFVINNIPAITQAVFDLIKTKITGITK